MGTLWDCAYSLKRLLEPVLTRTNKLCLEGNIADNQLINVIPIAVNTSIYNA